VKVVILAGGYGTRLAEITKVIPKPMVEIGGIPILVHIMNIYSAYGFNDFIIALGYKGDVIKEYFLHLKELSSDFKIDLASGKLEYITERKNNWKVTFVDTGENSMTGGRIKRLENIIRNETFMMTYGDAVSNIDINKLLLFHQNGNSLATVTAVHPPARFGELTINNENIVVEFKEKPQTQSGWINGGFFVFKPEIFDYIDSDSTVLEKEPLEKLSSEKKLKAYYHEKFWQSMDTIRDKNYLEEIWSSGKAPWKNNND